MNSIRAFFSFDKFRMVYWVIALATSQHTAWGAATTMQGSLGEGNPGWWLQGIAFAIAIDYTMVTVATKIRGGTSAARYLRVWRWSIPINWYTITFTAVALASFYFQLLYAWKHADVLQTGGGVTGEWVVRLQGLINARIVIAPAALPVIATLYTIGGLGKGGELQGNRRNPAQSTQPRAIDAIRIERPIMPEIEQPAQLKALPAPTTLRQDGKVIGYICPGCNKELSISGWSRHKSSCKQLVVSSNGHNQNGSGE